MASSSLSDSPSSKDSDEVSLAAEERGKADDVRVSGFRVLTCRVGTPQCELTEAC